MRFVRTHAVSGATRVREQQRLQLRRVELSLPLKIFQLDADVEDFALLGRIDGQRESRALRRACRFTSSAITSVAASSDATSKSSRAAFARSWLAMRRRITGSGASRLLVRCFERRLVQRIIGGGEF